MERRSWTVSALDVKLGLRMLVRHPGLSLISVTGMAVAIAIGAGYFTALGALLNPALPIPEGHRVVSIRNLDLAVGGNDVAATVHDLLTWRDQLSSIDNLGAFRASGHNLILADGRTEVVTAAAITANAFQLPRVAPLVGRGLVPEDEQPGAPPVIVLGHDAWQRVFLGADVIGQTVRLGEVLHTVVGVMPAGFRYPIRDQYWVPLRIRMDGPASQAPLHVFGRLSDGASLQQARAELAALGERMAVDFPATHETLRPQVLPFTHAFIGVEGPELELALRGFQILVGLLLVIVAINVSVLVYARTATRAGEIAVRAALGASRRRIVGQLFVEAGVLAGSAAVLGLILARIALGIASRGLVTSPDHRLPFWVNFDPGPAQVAYVVALALLASAIIGVIPALKVTGGRMDALKQHATRGSNLQLGRTWTALVVLQVAIAVAALPPALSTAGGMMDVGARAPGDAARELLRATLVTPEVSSAGDELVRRLDSEPEVTFVTYAQHFPGEERWAVVETEGMAIGAGRNDVAIHFFDVLDVPVVAGRAFTSADAAEGATAVLVDDVFAKQFGGSSAIGRLVRYVPPEPDAAPGPWYEIVGVVPSFTHELTLPNALAPPAPRIFHALPTVPSGQAVVLVRVRGNPAAFGQRFAALAASVDPGMHAERVEAVLEQWGRDRTVYRLVALGVAVTMLSVLMLSAAGIYAMMSFAVARRRREIGIRAALGADSRRVLTAIFRRAGAQLGAGVLAGLTLALTLEGVSPGLVLGGRGAVILPTVITVVVAVGLIAALGPARRGLAVQPGEVLREDA